MGTQLGNVDVSEWKQRKEEEENRRVEWELRKQGRRDPEEYYDELYGNDSEGYLETLDSDYDSSSSDDLELLSLLLSANPVGRSPVDMVRAINMPAQENAIPSSRFYAQREMRALPYRETTRFPPDFVLYRSPPPWTLLNNPTLDARTPAKEKAYKRPEVIKVGDNQKSALKNWHLSLLNNRKTDGPNSTRLPSPTPTLVNSPQCAPPPSSKILHLVSSLGDDVKGRSEERVPLRYIAKLSQEVDSKKPQTNKRPRLKLEPEDHNPFAKRTQPKRSEFNFKRTLREDTLRGAGLKEEIAVSRAAPRRSGTIQSLYTGKSGTSVKPEKADQKQRGLDPRTNAEHAEKKTAKLTQGTKPKEVQAFDWNSWSNKRRDVGL